MEFMVLYHSSEALIASCHLNLLKIEHHICSVRPKHLHSRMLVPFDGNSEIYIRSVTKQFVMGESSEQFLKDIHIYPTEPSS